MLRESPKFRRTKKVRTGSRAAIKHDPQFPSISHSSHTQGFHIKNFTSTLCFQGMSSQLFVHFSLPHLILSPPNKSYLDFALFFRTFLLDNRINQEMQALLMPLLVLPHPTSERTCSRSGQSCTLCPHQVISSCCPLPGAFSCALWACSAPVHCVWDGSGIKHHRGNPQPQRDGSGDKDLVFKRIVLIWIHCSYFLRVSPAAGRPSCQQQ